MNDEHGTRGTSGRAVLNWNKNTYTQLDDVDERFRDYHAQGIGNITGTPPDAQPVAPAANPLSMLDKFKSENP